MAERESSVQSPYRYASTALQAKIREHFRSYGSREVLLGTHGELDAQAGGELHSARAMQRDVLFGELRNQLSERDRRIFILLQQDITSPQSIGSALGISYSAAGKAVQRLRERLQAILIRRPGLLPVEDHDEHN